MQSIVVDIEKPPRVWGDIGAFVCGLFLPLAFSPFDIFYLSLILPAFLLILWLKLSPKRAFLRGWLFGLGFFTVGTYWVFISIHTYGQAPLILALLITLLFMMALALFPAVQGYVLARFFSNTTISKCLLAFPASWVILEWLRGWLFSGFPWLFIGYSQLNSSSSWFNPHLWSLAPIGSVYAVSWAVVFISGAIVALFVHKKLRWLCFIVILVTVLWNTCVLLSKKQWTYPVGNPLTVAMIQADIPQELKWQPEQVVATLQRYRELTMQNWQSNIILWPEAAITVLQTQVPAYLADLNKDALAHKTTLITGIPMQVNDQYYNGMMALGNGHGRYLKRHLVPFGEYMPFRSLLNWLGRYIQIPMSDFSSGSKQQPPFIADGISIAPFICYEIAYPTEVLEAFPQAQLIVTLTDDSWFGRSLAPAQHLQIAQMRALETGRFLLMSTNNGVTAIVNPLGQITAFAPPFEVYVLTGKVMAMQGSTPWVHMGIYPIMILMLIFLLAGWFIQYI
jgi:apolipoprotein N-acyltransferase